MSKQSDAASLILQRRNETRIQAQTDFNLFCKRVSGIEAQRHHRLLNDKLMDVAFGRLKRLMVFMPPGHAKSTYSSVNFPAFYLGVNPSNSIIGCSHTHGLAERFSRKAKNIVDGDEFFKIFGFGLSHDSKAAHSWETTRFGEFKAAGVSEGITGRRSDLGLIDDPVKSKEEAESETIRDKTWEWYLADFRTRLKPGGAIIIIQTRWHEDDLSGRILPTDYHGQSGFVECADGEVWFVINMPAICEQDDDLLGRKIGEALWPEYYTLDMLMKVKTMQTPANWAALYQQRPRANEGNQFDIGKMLVDGRPVEYPTFCDSVYAIIDTAIKDGAKHDGTAVSFYARSKFVGHPLVLLDWDIVQIQGALLEDWFPSINERLEELARETGARLGNAGAFVEDKGSGTILIQKATAQKWNCRAIDSPLTAMGKSERAINISGYIHQELFKMSEYAYNKRTIYKGKERNHWLYQVQNFRCGFDNKNDDLADTFFYGVALGLGDREGY